MRRVAGLITLVVLILLLLTLLTGQWLQRSLHGAGVQQLDWEHWRWAEGSLQIGGLSGVHAGEQGRLGFRVEGLVLRPIWDGGPRLQQVRAELVQLVWQPAAQLPASAPDEAWSLPALEDLAAPLGWLPGELQVDRLLVQLPCDEAFCDLQGSLQLRSQPQPLALDARLDLLQQEQWLQGRMQLQQQQDSYLTRAELAVPEPLPLPGIGLLSGAMTLDLENRGALWILNEGQAQWRLEQPFSDTLTALPEDWRPRVLSLEITPDPGSIADWQQRLELAVRARLEGGIEGGLEGRLLLASAATGWEAELDGARLQLAADRLRLPDLEVRGLALDWPLQGRFAKGQLTLTLGEQASLAASKVTLAAAELAVTGLDARMGEARLAVPLAHPDQLVLHSALQLGMQQLQHPALIPQGWTLNGELQHSSGVLGLSGRLAGQGGLSADLSLDWPAQADWRLQLTLGEMFLRAANPLAATFADWPELLSFSSGRLSGQLQARGSDGLDQLSGRLQLSGGQGIYDRASFSGLSAPLELGLRNDRLQLATEGLVLETVDPGLPLGPLRLRGSYTAELAHLDKGLLQLEAASIGVLEGQVRLEPARVDLSQSRQSLVALVEGVELARLFEVYPAEGLSGRGTLDGRFPVSLVDGKLLVDGGRLQAREPGGVLRYRAAQLSDMAAGNPGLEQLAAALDDFRYRVLASDVSYDEQGKLLLGLRLEGSNPTFQQGRQVNLNIQLEEDIPALLTSLQLSGQVNEIIRKRIEQRYLQRSP